MNVIMGLVGWWTVEEKEEEGGRRKTHLESFTTIYLYKNRKIEDKRLHVDDAYSVLPDKYI